MGFRDDFLKLAMQISDRKNYIENEETTKHSLIIPFIQVLGYDVFNPLEVRPEYDADFGKKKGEKVDYAIFKSERPIMFIEAKSVTERLDNHNAQLGRYFNSTPEVKIGILTNGIEYKFFTDLNQNNVMDSNPFFEINLETVNDNEIETIAKFKKEEFDTETLIRNAEELVYMANLNRNLKELFKNPSDEFIRFLIKDFSDTRITSNVIERFRPIVKKAISRTILDVVSQSLSHQDSTQSSPKDAAPDKETPAPNSNTENQDDESSKKGVFTSTEELECFEIVKKILEKNGKDVSELKFKDTVNYFGIFHKNGNHWFIRLNLNSTKKYILTRLPLETLQGLAHGFEIDIAPKGIAESRLYIDSYTDLNALEELIITCFDSVL